jgi:DNA-binding IclR family transcriptional regulator
MPAFSVTAIERILDIFEAFQSSQRPLSLTELAEAANIPKSTCHAIVSTLSARGYLYSLTRPRALYPTKRLYDVAFDIYKKDPFVERAAPVLERLRDASSETVILGKRQGDAVVYLHVVEGPQTIRYTARPGDIKPLHSSSIGKALLSTVPEEDLRQWLAGTPLPAITQATITDPEALIAELSEGRARGYFQTRGENVSDVWAVASTLSTNRDTFGVAVAGPRHRMEPRREELAGLVVETCKYLSRELQP